MASEIELPYKIITDDEVNIRFNNLKKYTSDFKNIPYFVKNMPRGFNYKYKGKYMIHLYDNNEYLELNLISDKWMEPIRLTVSVNNKESPHEYWNSHHEEIMNYAQTNYKNTDKHSLRESLYELSLEATTFKPSNAVMIYKFFNVKNALDISSGWGDRLIGAMACNLDNYIGVDPNPLLHPNYKKMIDFFKDGHKLKGNYIVYKAAFEKWKPNKKISSIKFDIVFSSPPYFNYEIYNANDDNQSIKNRDLNSWFDEFLMTSIKKSLSMLKNNGVLAININDIRNGPRYVINMINETKKFAKYEGCLSYSGITSDGKPRNPQPIWIFRKNE